MSLQSTAGQILDKLAELVVGPVLGTVTATTSAGVVILPQGQLGKLADGRLVRVRRAKRVGTAATPLDVRLELLTPAYPRTGNFAATPVATVITWLSPPAGINPTGLVSVAFAKSARVLEDGGYPVACLGAVGESEAQTSDTDHFAAGATGDADAVLLHPEGDPWSRNTAEARLQSVEWRWKLRVNLRSLSQQADRRSRARQIFNALSSTLLGATAGDDQVRFQKWRAYTVKDGNAPGYELWFSTREWEEGRVLQDAFSASLPTFDTLRSSVRIPGDATADPFRDDEDISVP